MQRLKKTFNYNFPLPNADGQMEDFVMYEASNFEPDFTSSPPQIRAYLGRGITDKYATLKLSISPSRELKQWFSELIKKKMNSSGSLFSR